MLRLKEEKEEITVYDIPLSGYFNFTLYFHFIFLFLFINANFGIYNYLLCFLLFLIITAIYFSREKIIIVKVNKRKRLISVRKRSLIKDKFNVYGFNDFSTPIEIDFVNKQDDKGESKMILALNSGEVIELSNSTPSNDYKLKDAVSLMNEIISESRKQIT